MRRFLFVPLALALALPASAQTHRRTVLDYFKMLPSKFFEVAPKERVKWLREGFNSQIPADNRSVVDLKNDFLRFPGDGAQSRLDVAVFRFHGQATVAVAEASTEGSSLSFWRERNGRLRDATKSLLPHYKTNSDYNSEPSRIHDVTFVLPRVGTTIRVMKIDDRDQPEKPVIARFEWRGGRFVRA